MDKKHKKIIADYLRYQTNDTSNDTDNEIINNYGGDKYNDIIAELDRGRYIYVSIDSNITCISLIDTNNMDNSGSSEIYADAYKIINN